jgi:hypothetical protein
MRGMKRLHFLLALGLGVAPLALATPARAAGVGSEGAAAGRVYAGTAAFARLMAEHSDAVPTPTFARQTGLACNVCHLQFPELTPFGQAFKAGGYTLRTIKTIDAQSGNRNILSLSSIPALSFMVQSSLTELKTAEPGTRNGTVLFPDQLSLFLGGAITPRIGSFVQVTYDPQSGTLGLDNTDIRFATNANIFSKRTIWGISLNNNPTVQDLWNSTPAWGYPFATSAVAPTPAAATMVDGTLAQNVAGISAYAFWNQAIYAEAGLYRYAPLGAVQPVAVDESGTLDDVAPYWRLALQRVFGQSTLMVGTYGLAGSLDVGGDSPPGSTDTFTDVAFDAQFFKPLGATARLSAHGTWIHETLVPGGVLAPDQPASRKLDTYRLDAALYYRTWLGLTVQPFETTGTMDPVTYPEEAIDGSRIGSPASSGVTASISLIPWLNTRFVIQYTAYTKFNGSSTNYDGAGRNASDNNTLYLLTWFNF